MDNGAIIFYWENQATWTYPKNGRKETTGVIMPFCNTLLNACLTKYNNWRDLLKRDKGFQLVEQVGLENEQSEDDQIDLPITFVCLTFQM